MKYRDDINIIKYYDGGGNEIIKIYRGYDLIYDGTVDDCNLSMHLRTNTNNDISVTVNGVKKTYTPVNYNIETNLEEAVALQAHSESYTVSINASNNTFKK
jgi:hypothetical protein